MKISIITGTFNSSKTIIDCIDSVNNQTYFDIEHIIIDGASKDNTLKLINSNPGRIKQIISEPDNGLYDAMNKGISVATGEIIGLLNSDDLYIDCFVIEKVMKAFKDTNVDCVYGDLYYVNKNNTNRITRHWKTNEFKPGAFKMGWHPAHPSFFLRRQVYDSYGQFDLTFKLAADFELMLRLLERYRISSAYLPFPLVRMRLGGKTNKSLYNIYSQNIECIKAFKKNGLTVSKFYPLYRLVPKLKQFFI
jgi:glycosyltransferase involved in cell wall biosynthesis